MAVLTSWLAPVFFHAQESTKTKPNVQPRQQSRELKQHILVQMKRGFHNNAHTTMIAVGTPRAFKR